MNRHDRKCWAACRTLEDLCVVTVAWLRGEVRQTPSHLGPPCDETTGLLGVLEAVNGAGFLTDGSQPGEAPDAAGSAQRAAVTGFADDRTCALLREMAAANGLWFGAHRAAGWRVSYRTALVVTLDGGSPFTWFGARLPRREVEWMYSRCHRDASRAVQDAWQVTVIDEDWGRNDRLWPALERLAMFANQPGGPSPAARPDTGSRS